MIEIKLLPSILPGLEIDVYFQLDTDMVATVLRKCARKLGLTENYTDRTTIEPWDCELD